MEFNPSNPIVQRCLQGMALEAADKPEEAGKLFLQAWNEATHDFEKFLAAHYVARHQHNDSEKLKWLETALACALKVNNESVKSALPTLYLNIAPLTQICNWGGWPLPLHPLRVFNAIRA